MDVVYHYPPELFQLLVDAIPRLCRSKTDVLTFFRSAGVENSILEDLHTQLAVNRESISKFNIAHVVLMRLNEAGESSLRERRELLKRVCEFEEYSTCWSEDRLKAQGLVSQIRNVVDVKDSFTRMRLEREEEARKNRETNRVETEAKQRQREVSSEILRDFYSLFSMNNPQQRGLMLEGVLNRYFKAAGISVREDFRRNPELGFGVIEQIDGVIEIDGHIYFVEMKWLSNPVGKGDIAQHLVNVFNRSAVRGIFISYSEYTRPAITICQESLAKAVAVLCNLEEFVFLLERECDLTEFLRQKIRAAIIEKQPYSRVLQYS